MDKYSLQNVEFFCKLFCYNFDDGENVETLGKRIQKLRTAKGFTQEELAQKLFLSSKTISSWEQDRTLPSLNVIVLLSEILDTTTAYFLYGDIKRLDIETENGLEFPCEMVRLC